ncbi:MAG: esterase [Porticoccaceae bacterium]|nr:MAG: esterase [Porticoccaceae bacterium]
MNQAADYLFLHGGGQGSWVWDDLVHALHRQAPAEPGRAVRLDVPGCGTKRGRDTARLAFSEVVAELVADLDRSGLRGAVAVGHSQAGTLLPFLAARRPEAIGRLVYLACSLPLPGQTVLEMMGTGLQGAEPERVGWPAAALGATPRERDRALFCNDMTPAQAETFLDRLGADAWPAASYAETRWQLEPPPAPAHYVICLRDRVLPVPWQERFARRLGAHRLVRLDAGHQAMLTRPHALAEILRLAAAGQLDAMED